MITGADATVQELERGATMLRKLMAMALVTGTTQAHAVHTPLSRLRTDGIQIVTPVGAKTSLRGINLGGWLLEEMWMTPFVQDPPAGSSFAPVHDSAGLWATVEKRFGGKEMQSLKQAWRDAWVQPVDFQRIKEAGFNHVRLPFLFDLLDEPKGMDTLRKAVKWANEAGLYVVLDMHGTPGRQSNDHTTGQQGVNRFFFDPANVALAEEIWTKIAREFGRNPGVAAFDLINEPTGAPNPATLHLVYNRLFQAVRMAAPDTIVIIDDGYKGFDTTPHADVAGWTNVVYSLHFYNFGAKSSEEHQASLNNRLPKTIEQRGYRNAPVYVGEFQIEPHGTPETMAEYLKTLSDNDFSWAVWTYKTMAVRGPMGFWGMYSKPGPADAINPFTDSLDVMRTKMQETRTERMSPAPGLLPVYQAEGRRHAAQTGKEPTP